MRIIISPAKKMNVDTDSFAVSGMPEFLEDTRVLMREIQALTLADARALWKCNDALAELNFRRFRDMELERRLTPAVMAYEGLQYRHMAPVVLTRDALSYIAEHLRILSGFYGLLRPFDGVTPYRLEMQAGLAVGECRDLYEFWGDRLYKSIAGEDTTILNLASREYSGVLKNTSPQRIGGSLWSSVKYRRERSGRKVLWPRWPEVKWCVFWRRTVFVTWRALKSFVGWNLPIVRNCPRRRNMCS